jgi:hypothetical protein
VFSPPIISPRCLGLIWDQPETPKGNAKGKGNDGDPGGDDGVAGVPTAA